MPALLPSEQIEIAGVLELYLQAESKEGNLESWENWVCSVPASQL